MIPAQRKDVCKHYLLSYKPSMPKLIVGLSGIIFRIIVIIISNIYKIGRGFDLVSIIVFLLCTMSFLSALMEMDYTRLNRKLMFLKQINISDIKSEAMSHSEVINSLIKYNLHYYIIKNEYEIHKIGVYPIWGIGKESIGCYYYLDEIQDGHIDRIKYMDFNHFVDVLNQINGYRDIFDVVSVYKIKVPKKRK